MGRRRDVLAALRASASPLGITEIAADLGVHPNTIRFHLDRLVANGQAERVAAGPSGPGRPPLMFRPSRRMDPTGPRRYELLAGILASSLAAGSDPTATATAAGRAWGAQVQARPQTSPMTESRSMARLVALLDDMGFAPERPTASRSRQIGLRHCPFLDLVQSQAEVICPVHLGLMQGAMAAMRAPVTVSRLDPFVEPDLCVAHLSRTDSAQPPMEQ
jgi:predicted ArsR family transcriptional regulator